VEENGFDEFFSDSVFKGLADLYAGTYARICVNETSITKDEVISDTDCAIQFQFYGAR
jgi:hypothetical protein